MYEIRHSNIQGQRNYGNSLLFNFEGPQSLKRQLKMDNGKWKVKIN